MSQSLYCDSAKGLAALLFVLPIAALLDKQGAWINRERRPSPAATVRKPLCRAVFCLNGVWTAEPSSDIVYEGFFL